VTNTVVHLDKPDPKQEFFLEARSNDDAALKRAAAIVTSAKKRTLHKKKNQSVQCARAPPTTSMPFGEGPFWTEGSIESLRPLVVTVLEARALLRIGNTLFWKLVAQGQLETIRLSAKTLVPVASIERLIDEQRKKSER
jgi:hypothetical protein